MLTWNEHTRVAIGYGQRNPNKIKVFAGLFLYSGMGSGRYYSVTGEVLFLEKIEAHEKALAENVKYVYQDSFSNIPNHPLIIIDNT